MAKRALPMVAAVVLLFVVGCMFICGCGGKIELGPKPALYATRPAHQGKLVDDMRTWLQSMSSAQVRTLEETGKLVFTMEELRRSDPIHAEAVDAYMQGVQTRLEQNRSKLEAKGFAVPSQLTPHTITFSKIGPGQYEVTFEYVEGGVSNAILSDPLPTTK